MMEFPHSAAFGMTGIFIAALQMLLLITAGLQIRQDGLGIFIAALQMLLLITAGLQIRQDGQDGYRVKSMFIPLYKF